MFLPQIKTNLNLKSGPKQVLVLGRVSVDSSHVCAPLELSVLVYTLFFHLLL